MTVTLCPLACAERNGKRFHPRRCALVRQHDEIGLAILRRTHRGTNDEEGDADGTWRMAQSYTAVVPLCALGVGYEPSRRAHETSRDYAALLGTIALRLGLRWRQTRSMTIKMKSMSRDRPPAVWATVGGYCDINKWLDVDCVIKSGDGGLGTVRLLRGGRVTEILVSKTDLSATTIRSPRAGGSSTACAVAFSKPGRSVLKRRSCCTPLMYDISDKADQAARRADVGSAPREVRSRA